MVKELDVVPDFTPGLVYLGEIAKFQYQGTLKQELDRRLTREQAVGLLEWMLTIRAFEQMVVALKEGTVKPCEGFTFTGATHLSIGQEAVAVGTMAALRPDEYITSTHRGHGHSIAKGAYAILGMPAEKLADFLGRDQAAGMGMPALQAAALQLHLGRTMAELLGREAGYCRGRGGGMHIADFHVNHLGANAIVGGSLAIATGAGLSMQKLGLDRVVACLFGDGAANNGIFHESLNFAAMSQLPYGLPVIYLIENNQYGMTGQQQGEVTGIDYLARRGAAYSFDNLHAEVVNGMDVLAVWDAVSRAAQLCRTRQGPVLLECITYRYLGHSLSDQRVKYRSPEEEASWRERDCVETYQRDLVESGALTESGVSELRAQVDARIQEALRFAAGSPEPDPATICEGLFSDTSSCQIPRQMRSTPLKPMRSFRRDSKGQILYRHAVCEALAEEMERDRRVIVFGEDVADYGGAFQVTVGLLEAFGRERVFNTAISEAAIAGVAAGAAMTGLRPVAEIMYIDFLPLAMDQVANQVAKTRYMFGGKACLPMVIRTTVGGGKGYAGQHSQSLEAMLTQVPGLKVVAPSTAYDAKGLLKSSIRDDNPVIFIEHQLLYTEKNEVPEGEYTVPLGVAAVRRAGTDLTIVAYLKMADVSLQAAELLSADGMEAEVIDARTLIPLDVATIAQSVAKTGRLLIVCQAPKTGCFGEHIAYRAQEAAFPHLKAAMKIVAAYDVPPPMAQTLEEENLPSPERVAREAKAMLQAGC